MKRVLKTIGALALAFQIIFSPVAPVFFGVQQVQAATDIVNDGTLGANVVACYELDEESGTRADSVASFDLTDNNTVGFAAAVWGNGADFESTNSEYLSYSGSLGLTTDGDVSVSFIYKPESIVDFQGAIYTGSATAGIFVRIENDGKMFAQFANAGGETKTRSDSVLFSAGNTYHIVVVFHTTSDSFDFYVNGSSAAETVFATAASGFAPGSSLYVGSTGGSGQYVDGVFDVVAIYDTGLTSGNASSLYASGAGIPCVGAAVPRRIIRTVQSI